MPDQGLQFEEAEFQSNQTGREIYPDKNLLA